MWRVCSCVRALSLSPVIQRLQVQNLFDVVQPRLNIPEHFQSFVGRHLGFDEGGRPPGSGRRSGRSSNRRSSRRRRFLGGNFLCLLLGLLARGSDRNSETRRRVRTHSVRKLRHDGRVGARRPESRSRHVYLFMYVKIAKKREDKTEMLRCVCDKLSCFYTARSEKGKQSETIYKGTSNRKKASAGILQLTPSFKKDIMVYKWTSKHPHTPRYRIIRILTAT